MPKAAPCSIHDDFAASAEPTYVCKQCRLQGHKLFYLAWRQIGVPEWVRKIHKCDLCSDQTTEGHLYSG